MHLLVTRPEPDAETLAAKLRSMGHTVTIEPMLRVQHLRPPIDTGEVQAIIVTSRNALRALSANGQLPSLLDLPVYAVGAATAEEARRMGFDKVVEGPGTATGLCRMIVEAVEPTGGVLLHPAGADLAVDPRPMLEGYGFKLRQPVVYQTIATTHLSKEARELLLTKGVDGIVFLSPRTAATFADLIEAEQLEETVSASIAYCLSRKVAKALAKLARLHTKTCDNPSLDEMLALIGAGTAR